MLSAEDNARITRVTGTAPAGRMMRQYWLPALMSEEVAQRDGTPVRLKLFGESLVAFRDSSGRLALIDAYCPHRRASLALGRNEEDGIRCIYHGWKFGTDGRCVDMPTEPAQHSYRDRMSIRSYPVREAGGLVWTYIGEPGQEPVFPEYDWMALPEDQRAIIKFGERANYLQALEGAIDSAHTWFLHRGVLSDWEKRIQITNDLSPRLEAEDTDYGFRYAAIRRPIENAETEKYVKVTLLVFPTTTFIPRTLDTTKHGIVQIFTPFDDERTMHYTILFSLNGKPVDAAQRRAAWCATPGTDLDRDWFPSITEENLWKQDREAMRTGENYVGIRGLAMQDLACQESMGPIVDRTQEHLGTSDVAIIRLRRRLLEGIQRFESGEPLVGQDASIPFGAIRSEQRTIGIDEPWQQVGAFAGEFAAVESAVS
jgi:phthalate 4,5-dioxygenase